VFITLFGPAATGVIRRKVTNFFNLSTKAQLVLFTILYAFIILSILVWCIFIANHTLNALVPIFIILAGSVFPYFKYLEGLMSNDREKCKGALSRAKSLLLFSIIIIIIYQVLTGDGLMGIKITI